MIPRLPLWVCGLLVISSILVAGFSGRPLSVAEWFKPSAAALAVSALIAGLTGAFLIVAAGRRRAERAATPIVAEYGPPEGLGPGEVAMLLKERIDARDGIAVVVDLARRGHLTIEESVIKRGVPAAEQKLAWRFSQRPKETANLRDYERTLIAGLFREGREVTVSDLAPSFFVAVDLAERMLQDEAHRQGWFLAPPDHLRAAWLILGLDVALVGACLIAPLGTYFGAAIVGVTLLASGLALVAARAWMPHRTGAGTETLRRIRGFERYMITAEAERQRFAEQETTTFADNLPYAIVFGLADAWVHRLRAIDSPGSVSHPGRWQFGDVDGGEGSVRVT